jgi:hypothetical protein
VQAYRSEALRLLGRPEEARAARRKMPAHPPWADDDKPPMYDPSDPRAVHRLSWPEGHGES